MDKPPALDKWDPIAEEDIQSALGSFTAWCLCGGKSLDRLLDRETRRHGDTDIGVFRSDLMHCLPAIDGRDIFMCDPPGHLVRWQGQAVADHVYDIWITDAQAESWSLQILVYDDDSQYVYYKRDGRIKWPKAIHALPIGSLRVLNPMVTFLYKVGAKAYLDMDIHDMQVLMQETFAMWTALGRGDGK